MKKLSSLKSQLFPRSGIQLRWTTPKGFTLIELLIVIAVLGILATVVIVAIDPLEQLARGRDAGRKTTAGQLKNAVQAYYTSHNATYPTAASWMTDLTNAGELKTAPAEITGGTPCATSVVNGYCYILKADGKEAAVYVRLESKAEISRCPITNPVSSPYFYWSSEKAQAGLVCKSTEPATTSETFTQ